MLKIDSLFPLTVLIFKRRRRVAFLDLYEELSFGRKTNTLFIDSTREIGIFLLLPSFFWRMLFQNVILLSTSYPATIASSVSLRRNVSVSNIVQKYFPKSIVKLTDKSYEFYPRIIAYYLIVINKSNFNPWYECTSNLVTEYYTRFPVHETHSRQIPLKCKVVSTYGEIPVKNSICEDKRGVLFAVPQFYEQGYVNLETSMKIIKLMLERIETDNPNSIVECSLHPRMNKSNYLFIPHIKHQNNLESILPKFKIYYTINSSTIFSALNHCEVRVFRFSFLDYSFIKDLALINKIQMIDFEYAI